MVAGLQSQQGTKHGMHLPVLMLKKKETNQKDMRAYLYLKVSTGAAPTLTRMAERAAGELHFS